MLETNSTPSHGLDLPFEKQASERVVPRLHIKNNGSNGLRLLFVTPRYLPFIGGVENHVYQVARRLVQRGVDVTVLTTDTTGTLEPRETLEGVKVQRVRAFPADRDY